ncbi:hypothetical protein Rsub_02777 [Raphidocelis subcapitata]|uniref:Tyrosinase copper-binding domain-containing protein n=1 Tax=Raphidocelis subcapitata TaxID=307507 RepID=A0A2V0NRW8_9CHLO|nr:hypothetical protein Rsub_02777 [Raphidocelis subcapitata]|eukprot:GBF90069.1 hypothetical protein Rsub_02777 [Raphidocelis subcapitata]
MAQAERDTDAPAPVRDPYFLVYHYKMDPCPKPFAHDWAQCPASHVGERAARRPLAIGYRAVACAYAKRRLPCPDGDACLSAHSLYEYWLHPDRFRTEICQHGQSCKRAVCFFAHSLPELRPTAPGLPPAELCWGTSGSQRGGAAAQRFTAARVGISLQDPSSWAVPPALRGGGAAAAAGFASPPSGEGLQLLAAPGGSASGALASGSGAPLALQHPQPYPQRGAAAVVSPTAAAAGGSAYDSGSAVGYWSGPAGWAVGPSGGFFYDGSGGPQGPFQSEDVMRLQQAPQMFQIVPQQPPYPVACALPQQSMFQVAAAQLPPSQQGWQLLQQQQQQQPQQWQQQQQQPRQPEQQQQQQP